MDDKNKFQEMLADIVEVARVEGDRLSRKEIRTLFGDMELTDTQYEHIFAYLAANHIKIEGYVETVTEYTRAVQEDENREEDKQIEEKQKDGSDENHIGEAVTNNLVDEDSIYLKMYLKDLEAIKISTPKEEQGLIEQILKGDSYAKNRFIEVNLRYIVQIASDYRNQGITLEDLIQEGNIGFLTSLESLQELIEKEKWKEFITDYVKRFIEAAIDEEKDSNSFENEIVEKSKYINDVANELALDLGREANINELAASTKLSVDEIQDILNMSVDAVKVNNHNHNQS